MRIAIIGAGVSGLVAAHRLHPQHEIVLFEAGATPGGHANTVEVDFDGRPFAVETGFIVFNDHTYPHFVRLLEELRVPSQPTTMGFSVHDETSGLEYAGNSINALFAQRRNLIRPSFYRMLIDLVRFYGECQRESPESFEGLTVGEFIRARGYSERFARWHLLPMGAAIWSCPTGAFADFPMMFVVEFFRNHGLVNFTQRPVWRVIQGGSRRYVDAIVRPLGERLRLNSPVQYVRRTAENVQVAVRGQDFELFDHVIFACHSDQALRMLGYDATPREREILSAFPYSRNVALLHTDCSLLPVRRRAWSSWNFRLSEDEESPACVTYNMNMLQGLNCPQTVCVTLNGEARVNPAKVLREFEYHHPYFTLNRNAAQARHRELLTANRTSYCGAYWGNGFHEDGVVSANAVVRGINALDRKDSVPPASDVITPSRQLEGDDESRILSL